MWEALKSAPGPGSRTHRQIVHPRAPERGRLALRVRRPPSAREFARGFRTPSSRLRTCHAVERRAAGGPPRCAAAACSRCRWQLWPWSPPAAAASAGATTARRRRRAPRPSGATARVLRAVTAQPLPSLDPAFATTRQSRAVANALCTPLVRYTDAEGLPGTVIVPGLARDLPIISRGSRTFRLQLLSGLHFADGRPLRPTTCVRRSSVCWTRPPARRVRRCSPTSWVRRTFADGEDAHLRGVRATAGRSRSRSSARIRRSWRGSRCRSPARSSTAPRIARCRGSWHVSRPGATASSRAPRR